MKCSCCDKEAVGFIEAIKKKRMKKDPDERGAVIRIRYYYCRDHLNEGKENALRRGGWLA